MFETLTFESITPLTITTSIEDNRTIVSECDLIAFYRHGRSYIHRLPANKEGEFEIITIDLGLASHLSNEGPGILTHIVSNTGPSNEREISRKTFLWKLEGSELVFTDAKGVVQKVKVQLSPGDTKEIRPASGMEDIFSYFYFEFEGKVFVSGPVHDC